MFFAPRFCEGAETEMADVLPDGWGAYQDDQGWAGRLGLPSLPRSGCRFVSRSKFISTTRTTYTVMIKEV